MSIVKIESNRYTIDEPLYQWDLNQILYIYGLSLSSIPEIHFTNDAMDRAIVRQAAMSAEGVISATVPNSLLQTPYKIKAYVCIYEGKSFESVCMFEIPVKARNKPGDYEINHNDDEIYSFNALENLVKNTIEALSPVAMSGDYNDLINTPTTSNAVESVNGQTGAVVLRMSDISDNVGYLLNETDPTVPSWAKASKKPSYTAEEVGAIAVGTIFYADALPETGEAGQICLVPV